ncbi:glycosyltransferase family 2 protein [Bariatricus massiliensis]|uniref:Glycosyltransferase family 2 protein n=1 Tax=Bariatricus massiliensis TaxID=1745713 RepID=A0ABS8DDL0_9FIRM|nr:glycosyltransferase family A protein [Bariatricus massiliensis]MCB7302619.1 glycosyltransferase family 2 protein [Bariatricus massiliensis]MCB7373835.1 glycosyltransferase family 2 protein [Bariatricus massiliensis]MCB7386505.1 glycosyltransferase family 2 protein [Bariatricus massiliensis]MCB7410667.1 glycosyltransferase family 2 protein [Bariatricus massiliensis]MCQ5253495.1 glycosyltransferase family 2 protein [Bariatricus massiliensis]
MDKILTIVIPAYNVENYIEKTIESLIIPEILDDIEILIINDGSLDTTEQKALVYEEKYPDSIRIISKNNGGHGSAINCGIQNATGKYVKILDGDDWVDKIGIQKLVEKLKKNSQYDLIINPFETVNNNTGAKERKEFSGVKFNYEYSFDEICSLDTVFGMPAITYLTSLLKEHHIHIDENRYYVDQEYNLFPVPYIKSVVFYEDCIYQYRIFNQSQSVSRNNFCKNRKMHEEVIFSLLEFLNQKKEEMSRNKIEYFLFAVTKMLSVQFNIYFLMDSNIKVKQEMLQFYEKVNNLCPEVFSVSKNKRIRLLVKSRFCLYPILAFVTKQMKKNVN